jgi:hypothetical protein
MRFGFVSYEIIKPLFHDFQDVENGTSDTLDIKIFPRSEWINNIYT